MIAAVTCPCSARLVVTSIALDSRPVTLFAARLFAVARAWAVDIAPTNSNTIGGICPACRVRSKGALYQEIR